MNTTTIALALTAAIGATGLAHAAGNPFAMQSLSSGYMVAADDKGMAGKCGASKTEEAKCGASKTKAKDGKCGEGKCGANKAKTTEGKCGGSKTMEGKCGGAKTTEGKCGASK